jgi:hypothetical protein
VQATISPVGSGSIDLANAVLLRKGDSSVWLSVQMVLVMIP